MSNVTKEWLQKTIAELEEERDATPGAVNEDASNALAAMKLALASLEAEPVAYIRDGFRADGVHFCGGIITAEEHERTKPALSDRYTWKHQPLYTAPPAPVSVPEWTNEQCLEFLSIAFRHAEIKGDLELDDIRLGVKMVNGSRAAMLQGAAGNSPVIPDGWVACSERMPEKADEVLCAKEFDGPGDWRQKVGYYLAGKWTVYSASWTPTHWQPLPAAPQREVK